MSFTKDKLVGMRVYDSKACLLGQVKDIVFTVGTEALSLLVGKEKEAGTPIAWKSIQSVGEIIVLKPVEVPVTQTQQIPACPSCRQPLTWIEKYKRWFCIKEQKYV